MQEIKRRLARLEAFSLNPSRKGDVRKMTDEQLVAIIIAGDIEWRKANGLPAVEYHQPLSDSLLDSLMADPQKSNLQGHG